MVQPLGEMEQEALHPDPEDAQPEVKKSDKPEVSARRQEKEESQEERKAVEPRAQKEIQEPSPEEKASHQLTHLPFKAWCRWCQAGRGRDLPHHAIDQKSWEGPPVVQVDYAYFRRGGVGPQLIVLGTTIQLFGLGASHVLRAKGRLDNRAARLVLSLLTEAGEGGTVRLRGDTEQAVQSVMQEVATLRSPARTILEGTPVGSSSSLGCVERWHQTAFGIVRTMWLELEERFGRPVPVDSPLVRGCSGTPAGWPIATRCTGTWEAARPMRQFRDGRITAQFLDLPG